MYLFIIYDLLSEAAISKRRISVNDELVVTETGVLHRYLLEQTYIPQ